MNNENFNPGNARLGALLRAVAPVAVAAAAVPGRRLAAHRRRRSARRNPESWLDALAALVLRPRFAFATVSALVLAGVLLGTYNGTQVAQQEAQARYLAVVAPNSLR